VNEPESRWLDTVIELPMPVREYCSTSFAWQAAQGCPNAAEIIKASKTVNRTTHHNSGRNCVALERCICFPDYSQ